MFINADNDIAMKLLDLLRHAMLSYTNPDGKGGLQPVVLHVIVETKSGFFSYPLSHTTAHWYTKLFC